MGPSSARTPDVATPDTPVGDGFIDDVPTTALDSIAARKVVPLRHPARWIASIVALVLLTQFVHALATNPVFQWHAFGYWFLRPVILQGLLLTLQLTALSAVFGLFGGIVLALMRLSRSPTRAGCSWPMRRES